MMNNLSASVREGSVASFWMFTTQPPSRMMERASDSDVASLVCWLALVNVARTFARPAAALRSLSRPSVFDSNVTTGVPLIGVYVLCEKVGRRT